MSEKDLRPMFRKLLIAAIITVFVTNGASVFFNAKVVQSDTKRNTESIRVIQKEFVRKDINNREHQNIMFLITNKDATNSARFERIERKLDENQKFIIQRIDKVNDNILKISMKQ